MTKQWRNISLDLISPAHTVDRCSSHNLSIPNRNVLWSEREMICYRRRNVQPNTFVGNNICPWESTWMAASKRWCRLSWTAFFDIAQIILEEETYRWIKRERERVERHYAVLITVLIVSQRRDSVVVRFLITEDSKGGISDIRHRPKAHSYEAQKVISSLS